MADDMKKEIEELSMGIVSALLTVQDSHGSLHGYRMAIMEKQKDGSERDIGGRGIPSMVKVISREIKEWFIHGENKGE